MSETIEIYALPYAVYREVGPSAFEEAGEAETEREARALAEAASRGEAPLRFQVWRFSSAGPVCDAVYQNGEETAG